jgi:hypothetical protein
VPELHHILTLPCTVPSQPILEHYRGLRLPPEVKKLQRWLDNIRQHPAIQATQRHPEGDQKYDQELMHHYSKYAGEGLHKCVSFDAGCSFWALSGFVHRLA